jgi:hypothetical protein
MAREASQNSEHEESFTSPGGIKNSIDSGGNGTYNLFNRFVVLAYVCRASNDIPAPFYFIFCSVEGVVESERARFFIGWRHLRNWPGNFLAINVLLS